MTYGKDFLLELDKVKNKEVYAKITALTFTEQPIETIEGRVTQGSINVDGASAVRRTCSLTIVAEDFNYNNYYWGLNTKFQLEIGVKNTIDTKYPDIIWFKQGIFLFTSFNTSRSTNNFTITLQGKDKMCLLNGDVGGSLESSVDFGTIQEENNDGIWVIKRVPIYDIIKNLVHQYAGEPYHKIIINDLDMYGLELLEYRYDEPMYLYREKNSNAFTNVTMNRDCSVAGRPEINELNDLTPDILEMLVDTLTGTADPKPVIMDGNEFFVAKVEYGQTAGYRETDLTYPGDLIANIGESITSVLDKIKNMLSEFEYFYDLDGQFIFQRKQSFVNTLWTPIKETEDNETYTEAIALSSSYSYIFNGSELITAFSNNPNILNMRNDYSIWGTRKGISGADIPVHFRYAIDLKPISYTSLEVSSPEDLQIIANYNHKYNTSLSGQSSKYYSVENGDDWREIIFQMANDYYKYGHLFDDFNIRLKQLNGTLYPSGITGYEQYYIDLQGFWRQLFDPTIDESIAEVNTEIRLLGDPAQMECAIKLKEQEIINKSREITALEEQNKISDRFKLQDANAQLRELQNELSVLQNNLYVYNTEYERLNKKLENLMDNRTNYYYSSNDQNLYPYREDRAYWNRAIWEAPEILNFWFDFLDGEGALAQFNVKNMGSRPKVINDDNVKSIYFRETPSVLFKSGDEKQPIVIELTEATYKPNQYYYFDAKQEEYIIDTSPVYTQDRVYYIFVTAIDNSGYKYIQVNDIDNMFSISSQGKSAKDRLDELIYEHAYCVENATITTIPIYYLQPNTRIYLYDEKTGLSGDYIISKLTIPLAYNGTMQITATKAAENII